jgi:hypothetical protein
MAETKLLTLLAVHQILLNESLAFDGELALALAPQCPVIYTNE